MNEENNIELRSEEFQEVLGDTPHWILRGGITLLAIVVLILLAGSAVFKYPDTIAARIVLTGTTPPAAIVARSSGKLNELYVSDNREVKAGDFLAVIHNPAQTEAVLNLKNYINQLNIENDSLILPNKELVVGDLQSVYSSFYTTLFDYKVNGLHSNLQSLISQIKTEIRNWEMSYVLMAPIDEK